MAHVYYNEKGNAVINGVEIKVPKLVPETFKCIEGLTADLKEESQKELGKNNEFHVILESCITDLELYIEDKEWSIVHEVIEKLKGLKLGTKGE